MDGIGAHPVFPVCLEWPTAGALRARHRGTLTEAARGVHATHHAVVHRAIRPPERLTTRAEIVGIEARKAGAYEITKFDTLDERGGLVNTTWYGTLYRQVDVAGGDRVGEAPAPPALSVSRIVAAEAGGDSERVAEISGRFSAMVFMPSEVTVRIFAREKIANGEEAVFFETLNAEGGRAVRDGVVTLRA